MFSCPAGKTTGSNRTLLEKAALRIDPCYALEPNSRAVQPSETERTVCRQRRARGAIGIRPSAQQGSSRIPSGTESSSPVDCCENDLENDLDNEAADQKRTSSVSLSKKSVRTRVFTVTCSAYATGIHPESAKVAICCWVLLRCVVYLSWSESREDSAWTSSDSRCLEYLKHCPADYLTYCPIQVKDEFCAQSKLSAISKEQTCLLMIHDAKISTLNLKQLLLLLLLLLLLRTC